MSAEGADGTPVKLGEARFALRSRAVCWGVDTGLFESETSSMLPNPIAVASSAFSASVVVSPASSLKAASFAILSGMIIF